MCEQDCRQRETQPVRTTLCAVVLLARRVAGRCCCSLPWCRKVRLPSALAKRHGAHTVIQPELWSCTAEQAQGVHCAACCHAMIGMRASCMGSQTAGAAHLALLDHSSGLALRVQGGSIIQHALGGVLAAVQQHVLAHLQQLLVHLLVGVCLDLRSCTALYQSFAA